MILSSQMLGLFNVQFILNILNRFMCVGSMVMITAGDGTDNTAFETFEKFFFFFFFLQLEEQF